MQAGGGSQKEERHGLAADVLRIDRRRKNPVRRVSINISALNIFCGAATQSACSPSPSPSRFPVIDMLH
jgi:hypothetical protein